MARIGDIPIEVGLDVKDKVIVLRRVPGSFADFKALTQLSRALLDAGAALVLQIAPDQSIDTLDEDEMRKAGWVRSPGMQKGVRHQPCGEGGV